MIFHQRAGDMEITFKILFCAYWIIIFLRILVKATTHRRCGMTLTNILRKNVYVVKHKKAISDPSTETLISKFLDLRFRSTRIFHKCPFRFVTNLLFKCIYRENISYWRWYWHSRYIKELFKGENQRYIPFDKEYAHRLPTTMYLWLIPLTASKELPILLLKLLEWVWQ